MNTIDEIEEEIKEAFEDCNKIRRFERITKPVERLTHCQTAKKQWS